MVILLEDHIHSASSNITLLCLCCFAILDSISLAAINVCVGTVQMHVEYTNNKEFQSRKFLQWQVAKEMKICALILLQYGTKFPKSNSSSKEKLPPKQPMRKFRLKCCSGLEPLEYIDSFWDNERTDETSGECL